MVVEILLPFFLSFFFFMGGGLGVVHHVYRGKITIHFTFTVNSFWESLFLCSCNYTVILQRFLKLSGSIISFLVYITMLWSKPVLKAHAVKAKIARYYTMQFGK